MKAVYKSVAITLFGARCFAVEFYLQSKMTVRNWIALQLVAAAITLAGPLKVYPCDEEGEEG